VLKCYSNWKLHSSEILFFIVTECMVKNPKEKFGRTWKQVKFNKIMKIALVRLLN